MNVRIRIAKWHIEVPTQREKDKLLERTCDARTRASRERGLLKYRRPWNTTKVTA